MEDLNLNMLESHVLGDTGSGVRGDDEKAEDVDEVELGIRFLRSLERARLGGSTIWTLLSAVLAFLPSDFLSEDFLTTSVLAER